MNKVAKYYSLIIICYLLELYIFSLLQFIKFFGPEIINFFIRFLMALFSAGLLRIFVFKEGKNFFRLYFLLSLVNPLISTALLYFLFGIIGISLLIAKIIGDVFTSLLLFYILQTMLKKQ